MNHYNTGKNPGTLAMTDVFFTTDVEIWCRGWNNLDREFPRAFRQYIHGTTPRGEFGLPFQLRLLNDPRRRLAFFVEPLFALRFGLQPLTEIVGLIQEAGQEVQLHLHPEWVDEAPEPPLPSVTRKRPYLRDYSLEEQTILIREGKALLERAGAPTPVAFRAGSYGMNSDTLHALRANDILFDSSYNACYQGLDSGVAPGQLLFQPNQQFGVHEYPITVFQDRPDHYRHVQLGACGFRELAGVMTHASRHGWDSVVIVSHSFELLDPNQDVADWIVIRRFRQLCRFLARRRDELPTRHFMELSPTREHAPQPAPFRGAPLHTGWRMLEQALRPVQYRLQAAGSG